MRLGPLYPPLGFVLTVLLCGRQRIKAACLTQPQVQRLASQAPLILKPQVDKAAALRLGVSGLMVGMFYLIPKRHQRLLQVQMVRR